MVKTLLKIRRSSRLSMTINTKKRRFSFIRAVKLDFNREEIEVFFRGSANGFFSFSGVTGDHVISRGYNLKEHRRGGGTGSIFPLSSV